VGLGIGALFLLGGIAMGCVGAIGVFTSDIADRVFELIGAIWGGVGLFLILLFVKLAARRRARQAVALTGVEGTALVEAAETTNTYINGVPKYRLDVELRRNDGGPTRRCTKRALVPNTVVGRWGVGTALPVRISRDDPADFEILWDELPAPGTNSVGVADELSRLGELAQRGLLSPTEWERAKELYLGKPTDRRDADTRLLVQLHDLYRDGGLSESEFNTKKWEILART
jgi:hypothetical protein